jgi:hypothetical protein
MVAEANLSEGRLARLVSGGFKKGSIIMYGIREYSCFFNATG